MRPDVCGNMALGFTHLNLDMYLHPPKSENSTIEKQPGIMIKLFVLSRGGDSPCVIAVQNGVYNKWKR